LAIGLFFGNVEFTSADDKIDKIKDKDYINSLRINDSIEGIGDLTKEYIADDKELKINDKKGLLVDLKLLTPYENKVSSSGIEPIAKWQAIDWSDKWKLFDKIDSYKINDDYKVKDKNYVLKYLVETEKTNCYDESQINNETLENETKEYCYDYIQKDWIKFKKVKDLPHKNITIGLFANSLVEGEHIEFIPTIEGFEVLEWASYLVTDLVSYYKLDENAASTTVADAHGSNDGTASTNTNNLYNASGKLNSCFNLVSSSGEMIVLPQKFYDYGFDSTGSIALWCYIDTSISEVTNMVYDYSYTGGLAMRKSGYDDFIAYIYPGNYRLTITNAFTTSGWYHIAMVLTGGNYIIYINGINAGDLDSGNLARGTGPAYIGHNWDEKIDEVGIWSRALTSTEITALYNSGSGLAYPLTTVYCNFSGYAFDQDDTALVGANVTVWNQFNVLEYYSNTTIADGKWSVQVPNSTNTYMAGAYYNNTLIGQLKQGISGTC